MMSLDKLFASIENLESTSAATIKKFKSLGIDTFWDLLNYVPIRYADFSKKALIKEAQVGERVTVQGEITDSKQEVSKRGLKIQMFTLQDESDFLLLIWFNQPYLLRTLKKGMRVSASGEVKSYFFQKALFVEEYEILNSANLIHTARIVPYYSEKKGLSSRVIREKVFSVLEEVKEFPDIFPERIVVYNDLLNSYLAYKNIHFPESKELYKKARDRLAFDEIFVLQLIGASVRSKWAKEKIRKPFSLDSDKKNKLSEFIFNLPFKLTGAQQKAVEEIIHDMIKPVAMNRFLQGDVGAGKTVVAAIAAYFSYLNGFQTLFMAPTEVLALQHLKTFEKLFANYPIKLALQTGSIKTIKDYEQKIKDYDIIIGTHALFNEKLKYERVGLVVIDEQQRFGVMQRALLKSKGFNPHLLTMTATPIPRTVALVLFGELNLSILDEMPKGRKPVKTFFVPNEKRESAYEWIRKKVKEEKEQVFIVCPLIEESEHETMKNVKSAISEYEKMKKIFPDLRVGLLHGKMRSKEKNQVLKDFKDHKLDILVATPVIEVGIDIPNATVMVIEAAERYGLAQLHQLRGRVGRSDKQSYCLVFSESSSPEVIARLRYFAKENNGFKLSEYDLKLRGPGEIYGLRQHGYLNVKFASLLDKDLIEKAKRAVDYFVNNYDLEDYEVLKSLVELRTKKLVTID